MSKPKHSRGVVEGYAVSDMLGHEMSPLSTSSFLSSFSIFIKTPDYLFSKDGMDDIITFTRPETNC